MSHKSIKQESKRYLSLRSKNVLLFLARIQCFHPQIHQHNNRHNLYQSPKRNLPESIHPKMAQRQIKLKDVTNPQNNIHIAQRHIIAKPNHQCDSLSKSSQRITGVHRQRVYLTTYHLH